MLYYIDIVDQVKTGKIIAACRNEKKLHKHF